MRSAVPNVAERSPDTCNDSIETPSESCRDRRRKRSAAVLGISRVRLEGAHAAKGMATHAALIEDPMSMSFSGEYRGFSALPLVIAAL